MAKVSGEVRMVKSDNIDRRTNAVEEGQAGRGRNRTANFEVDRCSCRDPEECHPEFQLL